MKTFTNTYIIIYSAILVAMVAVFLSFMAVKLQPLQKKNQRIETYQMILEASGNVATAKEAESLYKELITEETLANGDMVYLYEGGCVLPFSGVGLWGPIWGYMAFDTNFSVTGAVFDHKGETPGLGGELATPAFAEQFIGKKIIKENQIVPIVLMKQADQNSPYEVDAITGGTLTSDGINQMIADGLEKYKTYIESSLGKEDCNE